MYWKETIIGAGVEEGEDIITADCRNPYKQYRNEKPKQQIL